VDSAVSSLERLIRRDRLIVGAGLALLTALSWIYLAGMSGTMHSAQAEADMHAAMGMPEMAAWGPAELAMLFIMWSVMMVGMMVPSAAPLMLLVLGVYRRRAGSGTMALGALFVCGYLLAWIGFSGIAAAVQLLMHQAALLSPQMASRSAPAAGVILIVAGLYQWLPIKNACLAHCRSPLTFLTEHWREGPAGAFSMGATHGLYCVGCCWALMALLFVVGVMNLLWVAAIAAFVLVEKLTALGPRLGRSAGVLLIIWGGYVLARSLVA
jgi:predicted metal-binding membrane protein